MLITNEDVVKVGGNVKAGTSLAIKDGNVKIGTFGITGDPQHTEALAIQEMASMIDDVHRIGLELVQISTKH